MKNIEIVNLSQVLTNYIPQLKELKGAKFAYALNKNMDKLKAEAEAIKSARIQHPDFARYEKARVELCERLAFKDEAGKPKTKLDASGATVYDLDGTEEQLAAAFKEIALEHQDAIQEQTKMNKDFNDFLQAESELALHMVNIDDVPEDISTELMAVIMAFVKE